MSTTNVSGTYLCAGLLDSNLNADGSRFTLDGGSSSRDAQVIVGPNFIGNTSLASQGAKCTMITPDHIWWYISEGSPNSNINPIYITCGSYDSTNNRATGAQMYIRSDGQQINLDGSTGSITTTGSVQQGSDMTKKDVVADTTLTVDQIADAPSIQFTWKTDANKVNHVGTSAQYWQEVMPEVVNEHNDSLYMDYASTAVVSAITIAKEVVALKEEIAQLKQELAELKGNNNE